MKAIAIILAVLLLITPGLARSPMIGDFVNIHTSAGYYEGQVESCDFGFLCLNATLFREPTQPDGRQGTLHSASGYDICIGIGQIQYLSFD